MMLDALRLAFFATLMLGGASLERLSETFGELGAFGEARFVGLLLVATALALRAAARGKPEAIPGPLFVWLLLLALLHAEVATSWLWSDRTPYAWTQLLELGFSAGALALAVPLFRDAPERCLRLMLVSFYAAALAFVLASLAFFGAPAGELASAGAGGIGSARLLCMGIVAAVWLLREAGQRGWALLLPTPLMLAGAVASGSRASVLALAVSLGVCWMRWQRESLAPVTAAPPSRAAVVGLAGVALFVVLAVPFTRGLATLWLEQLLAPSSGSGAVYLADRDVIFLDGWRQFSANALAGIGIGSYVGPFGEQYPHNLLLSYAIDAGGLALACALWALGWGFAALSRQRGDAAGAALSGAAFFAVASCFAGSYYDARFLWIFLLLGFLLRAPVGARAGVVRFVRASIAQPSTKCASG